MSKKKKVLSKIDDLEEAVARTVKGPIEVTSDPDELFVVPLSRRPFFPGMAAPLVIEPGSYYEMLKQVSGTSHKTMGLFLTKNEEVNIYELAPEDFYQVGVSAKILRIIPMEQGGAQVILNMEKRIKIEKGFKKDKFLCAKVSYQEDLFTKKLSKMVKAYSISIISTIKELLKLNPLFKEELQIFLSHSDFTDPGKLADFAVALTTASREELQEVLEAYDLKDRIGRALSLLKKELDLSKLQSSINQKIEANVSKAQREFFLKEQLKTIKKELGLEKDDKSLDLEKFDQRLEGKTVPAEAMQVIQEEMEKLSVLEVQSGEYATCRNYLDWLTNIPWGVMSGGIGTDQTHNLKHADQVLKEDHYGLEDIKQRILEFIAVGKLSGGVKGSIIGLIGPPGVGKTSIGKSVARALDRKFFRFSVGGMRDEAEIKGHRRTYIGAMPGKMIQALKHTQVMNPVIMLDEVDKIGMSYHGDPASALLEVLDPEQNVEFLDHYLDVRVDLSNVLFILTANVIDSIPEPLRDRMEILRLSGYIQEEKVEIAKKYLIPRNREKMGLKASDISFSVGALKQIINGYAREAGVRSLENLIKKVMRKVAIKIVKAAEKKAKKPLKEHKITEKEVVEYLGKPIFTTDRFYDKTPVGVAMGLAWTALGGATLYIEALRVPSDKTTMKLTGQAGDVMKESSQIAWTYVHSALSKLAPTTAFFERQEVHLHIPEGATPKDGPSAGVTMATALFSLLLEKPIKPDLGMTGELTLTGKVLPVGGIKEKVIASRRSKLKTIILPKDNERDVAELAAYVKKGLKFLYVTDYKEVFHAAFDL